jgi:hypothetical protein
MDLNIHRAIAGRLEQGKALGWLSDYLVAWHGPSGRLSPNVTVWRAPAYTDDEVRTYLSRLLTGFVSPRAIEVERG